MAPNHNFVDPEIIEHGSPLRLPGHPVNGQPMDLEGWSGIQTEVHILIFWHLLLLFVVVFLLVLHACLVTGSKAQFANWWWDLVYLDFEHAVHFTLDLPLIATSLVSR